jgi:menaquinone-dependent protoporphyrinogen oxidase
MNEKILVAYATKYGATAEIAEKIAGILRQAGLQTDVLPANRVTNLALYRAVILGSAVYMGSWRKEAVQFLKIHEQALAERAVWLFSNGPAGVGDPVKLLNGWHFPPAQQPLADRIHPMDVVVFHGNLDLKKLNIFEKSIISMVKSQTGDFRDWEAITAWASSIADTLNKSV